MTPARPLAAALALLALPLAAGCGTEPEETPDDPTPTGTTPTAPSPLPDDVPPEGPATVSAWASGPFAVLASFEGPTATVYGQALAVRRVDGTAGVGLAISGLAPGVEHMAHVHALPCASDAGGHYLVDPAAEAGEANEVWPMFTTDADGNGVAWMEVPAGLRGDAMSVVVHDPATSAKLACADLLPEEPVGASSGGAVAPFAAAEAVDEAIGGEVSMITSGSRTTVTATFSGLDPASDYVGHVHALPCDALDGGGHYKLDPLVTDTDPLNEIWLSFTAGPEGGASTEVEALAHSARSDAQSVVVHRVVSPDSAPKVACADLARESSLPIRRGGPAAPLAGATVGGSASLERRLDGATVVSVDLTGLTAGARHPIHLHALPCAVADGGGHTLLDPTAPAGPENELWIEVVADRAGAARRAVGVAASVGADAQSVVVHAEDGARLACADLR